MLNVPQTYSFYTIKKHIRMMRGKWTPGWETEYSIFDFINIAEEYKLDIVEVR